MRIGGLLKFSLIDYPGKVAAVIFTQGCNYRCPFCHNPELVLPDLFNGPLDIEDVFGFLQMRRGQIQGVVVTGGEPTIHDDLCAFLQRIRDLGYLIKLDTNGSRPDILRRVIEAKLADLFAMDIKASPEGYCKAAGVAVDMECVKASIALIKDSGAEYFFRTTALKGFLSANDLESISALLGPVRRYKLQRGNLTGNVLNKDILDGPVEFSDEEWARMKQLRLSSGQVLE